jgi:sugar-specific transcriptional regulator TrmB
MSKNIHSMEKSNLQFGEELSKALSQWLQIPPHDDERPISWHLRCLAKAQDFIINYWSEFSDEQNAEIKSVLTCLQSVKEQLKEIENKCFTFPECNH